MNLIPKENKMEKNHQQNLLMKNMHLASGSILVCIKKEVQELEENKSLLILPNQRTHSIYTHKRKTADYFVIGEVIEENSLYKIGTKIIFQEIHFEQIKQVRDFIYGGVQPSFIIATIENDILFLMNERFDSIEANVYKPLDTSQEIT